MTEKSTGIVGLMADPGWPTRIAKKISRRLAAELSAETNSHWEVDIAQERLPLDSEGEIPLFQHAPRLQEAHGWDYLIYLTDLPLLSGDKILLSKASAEEQTALISIPSVGATRATKRVKNIVLALVTSSHEDSRQLPSEDELKSIMGPRIRYHQPGPDDKNSMRISLSGHRHRLGLLIGTIRSNQPSHMLAALTNSIALGAAAGAFGIFYGSIWDLSSALSPVRLLFISLIVTMLMGFWLILKNSLWAPARNFRVTWQAWIDILATTATIAIGVSYFYIVLFGVLLLLSLIVVESGYLSEELGYPAQFVDYLSLTWLSASLGMLAGALGSNFNSEESIREATYSNRVYERRKLADEFENPDDSDDQS